MPIFEIEKDGKIFEVDAPDINAAASSLGGGPPGGNVSRETSPPVPERVQRTGFAAQVNRTMSGQTPLTLTPEQTAQNEQTGQRLGSIVKGGAIGAAQSIPGLPGNVEALGRFALSPLGVSRDPALPTSNEVGDAIAGPPSNQTEANARFGGEFLGPGAYSKVLGATARGADKAAGFMAQQGAGMTTGAGAPAIQGAYQAGRQGGRASETFLGHMRGNIASDEAVELAKRAVAEMRAEKSVAYRAGIGSTIKNDPAVLDFKPIEAAINSAANVKMFKGQSLSSVADKARQRISEVVDEWKALDPAEFHTPEGLDALKQKLSDLIHEGDLSSIKPNSPASIIVNNAYNAVKDQIVRQAPGYADVMGDYMRASDQIREVEKTLSLGNKATADAGLRKLQSILRNNANTNYGARVKSGEALAARQPDLMPALSGQALNSATPRALQGVVGTGVGLGTLATGGPAALASALPALALTSPRLMGEAAFALGNARRVGSGFADGVKKAVVGSGGANVPSIPGMSPTMLGMMTPQMLAQLLALQNAPR